MKKALLVLMSLALISGLVFASGGEGEGSESEARELTVWENLWANAAVSVIESIVVRSWPSIENSAPSNPDIARNCTGFKSATKCGRVSWRELR